MHFHLSIFFRNKGRHASFIFIEKKYKNKIKYCISKRIYLRYVPRILWVTTFTSIQIWNPPTRIYIYIYHPLYTNWPITNADLSHVIIQYILYFVCQKLYWTVNGQLSNIEYIGQFQNEATGTLRTRYRRIKAVSMYLMKTLSIFLHLRKILICFRIGCFL